MNMVQNVVMKILNVHKACWIEPESLNHPEFIEFKRVKQRFLATDKQGQLVFFADSMFYTSNDRTKIPFHKIPFDV